MKSELLTRTRGLAALLFLSLAPLPILAQSEETHPDAVAIARLQPAKDQDVRGTVQFIPADGGMRVLAHVVNLTPGKHGFHVHEKGDLSAPDLSSAGGHFNPTDQPHGGPHEKKRHVGDLGNLEANARGVATLDYIDKHLSISGPNSIIGRAVIVHAKADDLTSQPSGDAGGRVAGGVIERFSSKTTTKKTKS